VDQIVQPESRPVTSMQITYTLNEVAVVDALATLTLHVLTLEVW
jgi:hypothetical protein